MGLLAIGFIIVMWGGSWWWLGIGLILISAAVAISGTEEAMVPVMPVGKKVMVAGKATMPSAKAEDGFDVFDMKWSPTAFADGMMGVNPMKGDFGGSVGARTGAFTQDMDLVRFKDDIRIRISTQDPAFDMLKSDAGPLTAWDFRTRKDALPGIHTAAVKTVTSPDEYVNPGLGSPNEWLKAMKGKKDKR